MQLFLQTTAILAVSTCFLPVASSTQVEIALLDVLDGVTSNYCLDIAGGNTDIDPANGLQAHTCYSYQGALGTDQVFETDNLASGALYMPEYDVCAEVSSIADGATVELATCDDTSDLQAFAFGTGGTISPASDTSLCFTASSETRFGRSDVHQIADLALAACSDAMAAYQQWGYRTTLDEAMTVLGAEAAETPTTTTTEPETTTTTTEPELEEVTTEDESGAFAITSTAMVALLLLLVAAMTI